MHEHHNTGDCDFAIPRAQGFFTRHGAPLQLGALSADGASAAREMLLHVQSKARN